MGFLVYHRDVNMGITAPGRMINADISRSRKIASLSPKAMSLFCLLIPHFNAHGKMLANVHLIKGLICPYIEWLPVDEIEALLMEISDKTNVKYWTDDSGEYLQSLNWIEHQQLRADRLGKDYLPDCPDELPDYSRTTPGLLPLEVKEKLSRREEEDLTITTITESVSTRMTPGELRQRFEVVTKKRINSGSEITVLQDLAKEFTTDALEEGLLTTAAANPDYPLPYFRSVMKSREPPQPKIDTSMFRAALEEDRRNREQANV
jgi:hypothetical protein